MGPGAFSVVTGDFNGDGIVDLVSANQGSNTVSVALGNLYGGFAAQVTYPTGPAPTAVVSGDFNNDGSLDLAVTNSNCDNIADMNGLLTLACNGYGTVSILLGNGDGTFQPHVDYSTGKNPSSLAAADFNGDGNLDLALVNVQDGTVSVLLGRGDGSLQPQVLYTVTSAQALIVGDFNSDRKLDLVVDGNTVFTLLGNGDGTFQTPLAYAGNFALAGPLAAADFNLDGKLDLYAGGNLFLGNGDGTFLLHTTYPAPTGIASAVAVDLNGDAKPDLVIAQQSALSILLGNGDGSFQTAVQYAIAPDSAALAAQDINGDGKLDLVVAESGCDLYSCSATGSATVSVLLGLGDGTLVGPTNYPFQGIQPAIQVLAADFNGDGKPDFAALSSTVGVYMGKGDGTLQAEVSTPLPQPSETLATADFNGDGRADLAITNTNCNQGLTSCLPGQVQILIGNGDGTFQSPVEYGTGLQPRWVVAGDFNGDGKPDLATSNFSSNTVSILLNDGSGKFPAHSDFDTGLQPGVILSGDFNGDGKLDVVTQTQAGISLQLGNGDGTLGAHLDYAVTAQATSLCAGDFNGDGKLDLAVTAASTPQVFILLGNGDGTFQKPVSYIAGPPSPLAFIGYPSIGDFNGDGKTDLYIAPDALDGAVVLLGNGDGTFGLPIFTLLESGSAALLDLNGDGVTDVVAPAEYNGNSHAISVLLSTAFKAVAPASLNFAAQAVGTTSAPQTITVSNPASVPFSIHQIAASANFSQTNDCGTSLAPAAHCKIAVSFSPTSTEIEKGTITVSDSTRGGPVAIPLTGNGPSLEAPDFKIGLVTGSQASQTVPAGQNAQFSLGVTSVSKFAGAVNLSCTISPAAVVSPTCNISSATVQLNGSGLQTATVTVATAAPISSHARVSWGAMPAAWLAILVGGWLLPQKRRVRLLLAITGIAFVSTIGCGGGGSSSSQTTTSGTTAGTYTVTLTATSGSLSHSVTMTVVVQ